MLSGSFFNIQLYWLNPTLCLTWAWDLGLEGNRILMAPNLYCVPATQVVLWAVGESVHFLVGTVGKMHFLLCAHP